MDQSSLGFDELSDYSEAVCDSAEIFFKQGNAHRLFVGDKPLKTYLQENGLSFVIQLSAFLEAYDFSGFIKAYSPTGRRAAHPRIMMGLIIYGMLNKQWSLRQLETLAVRDVGAWWICGGLQPDHSTIGKFFNQHSKVLSEDFFVTLTRQLVRQLKLTTHDAAGDGTVIEAASSHYRILKADAARLEAEKAEEEASLAPDNKAKQTKALISKEAADIATNRQALLNKMGKPSNKVCVSSIEPTATVQPLKNKVNRPAYKPSILVDQNRFIVGQYLHPTNENLAISPMLEQHEQIHGQLPGCTMLDAGYHNIEVLQVFNAFELDILCPSGAVEKTGKWKKQSHQQLFGKSDFHYDDDLDAYICPEKKKLTPQQIRQDVNGRKYRYYIGKECSDCPIRSQCTKSARGRSIKRYDGEELKEAMMQVLQHPRAKEKYRQRKALVEPVFAELKERQSLKRFHRRGLQKVKIEFAIHCVAYNLKRAIRLSDGLCLTFFVLYWRKNRGPWKIHSSYSMVLFTKV